MIDPPELRACKLTVRYLTRRAAALRDITFEVERGERLLLAGPSGSGKSTLALCLTGLLPTGVDVDLEGILEVEGRAVADYPRGALAERVGIVFQDPGSQFTMLTVEDEVAFGLENLGVSRPEMRARVARSLAAVNLTDRAGWRIDRLSGGLQQRVALAAALAMEPPVLVLDEPTAHLDPRAAGNLYECVGTVAEALGTTLIVVEHDIDRVVPGLLQRCLVLTESGELAADGSVEDLFGTAASARRWIEAGIRPPTTVALRLALDPAAACLPLGEDTTARWLAGAPESQRALRDLEPRANASSGDVVLEARNLWSSYKTPAGEVPVLRGVDLAVREGELVAIVGINGSGKTTLLRALSGLVRPVRGSVEIDRANVQALGARETARRVAHVFQNPESGFVADTVAGELSYTPRALGWSEEAVRRYREAFLERFGLAALANASPYTLSGGQKRRLSVATALVSGPRALLLDEPTFGQDQASARALMREVAALRDEGLAVVVATHESGLVAEEADRVVALAGGAVVFDGSPRELFADERLLALTGQERPALSRTLLAARAYGAHAPANLRWRDLSMLPGMRVGAPGSAR